MHSEYRSNIWSVDAANRAFGELVRLEISLVLGNTYIVSYCQAISEVPLNCNSPDLAIITFQLLESLNARGWKGSLETESNSPATKDHLGQVT